MPKYYAYIPREDGTEPTGSANRAMWEGAGGNFAIRMAKRRLGTDNYVLLSYTNFYDDSTFKVIKGKHIF